MGKIQITNELIRETDTINVATSLKTLFNNTTTKTYIVNIFIHSNTLGSFNRRVFLNGDIIFNRAQGIDGYIHNLLIQPSDIITHSCSGGSGGNGGTLILQGFVIKED